MKQALWHLIEDFLSAVLFLMAYAASRSLGVAVAIVVLAALAPLAGSLARRRRIAALQWLSLGLVLVLGAAAWLSHSPRFIMAKPSAVHFVLAAVMSRGGWMLRYLNAPALENVPKAAIVAAGHGWAVLMAALGFTNLIIALYFNLAAWAWFVTAISLGVKIAALALQYAVCRTIVRRRLGRAAAVATSGRQMTPALRRGGGADITRGSRG